LVRPVEQRRALRAVERAATRVDADEQRLLEAMRLARAVDAPLRAIAEAAHMSHPKVMAMLRAEQNGETP
jgi:chaperonin GroEL (HSP60 family)